MTDGHCDHCGTECRERPAQPTHIVMLSDTDNTWCGTWVTGHCPACKERARIREELLDALNDGGYDGLLTYMEGL